MQAHGVDQCFGMEILEADAWGSHGFCDGCGQPQPDQVGLGVDDDGRDVLLPDILRHELLPSQISEIALDVEPSDGIMLPDIALFDHREGRIARILGAPPLMRILVLDFGGNVDTQEFNQVENGRGCALD